jgi:hypothetical protein
MPLILSFALLSDALYAAGPDGLFRIEAGELTDVPQPMSSLACCAACDEALLVGGSPHGVAFRMAGGDWKAGWVDYTTSPALAIAPAPRCEQSGVLLAATAGEGILRSTNRGRTWQLCNFGMRDFTVLTVAWAPPPPARAWPAREVAFAGTEHGMYRSPAAGLGWQQVAGLEDAIQAIAVSPEFHSDGVVLAGGEESGLWRSSDAGRRFAMVAGLPGRIDAIALASGRWVVATPDGIWTSRDAVAWSQLSGSPHALCLQQTAEGVWAGGEFGVTLVDMKAMEHD